MVREAGMRRPSRRGRLEEELPSSGCCEPLLISGPGGQAVAGLGGENPSQGSCLELRPSGLFTAFLQLGMGGLPSVSLAAGPVQVLPDSCSEGTSVAMDV